MVCVPTPAVEGVKTPLETPVPLYVPPVGIPPESVIGDALMQADISAGQVTIGNGLTVTVAVAVAEQPSEVVTVTVYIVVIVGLTVMEGVTAPPGAQR